MYSFTIFDASEFIPGMKYSIGVRQKAVTNSVARFQIKRFKHKNYVRMFNGWPLSNVIKRRIG